MDGFDVSGLAERLEWEDKEYWFHVEADSPLDKYPAKQHARNVQVKLGVDEGLIYLPGQSAKNNEDSDMPAPFRQLRYFYYLSGCNEPDCHLTYDIRQDTLTLFIPRVDPKRVIWNGRGSTPAEALVKYDIDAVLFIDQLASFVQCWTHRSKNQHACIYGVHPLQIPRCPAKGRPGVDTTSLLPAMNVCRMVKDDHEIALIRKANDISSQAHKEVLANILKFKNEAEVEGIFMDVCISKHAKEQAYDPIAASGPNAGTLHYDANDEDFEDRQLMCLDAGCEYELYASDVTRTFPLAASWPTREAENIYKLVERMQEECIERLAPGVRYLDLHIRAHQIAIDGLLQLGIFHSGTREEIYKAGTSRAFFPHGLGHHIGLEVHDVGQADLMSVRRGKIIHQQAPSLYPQGFHTPVYEPTTCHAPTDPQSSHLEAGMVVTVEPGIYFSVYALQQFYLPLPEHAKFINLEVLERYIPVGGVRIEDDILITPKGYENLTTAPKGEAMFDIIRGKPTKNSKTEETFCRPRRRSTENTKPLLRAPGLKSAIAAPVLRSLARAETMPTNLGHADTIDFEPFSGPSLFSNFKRSMTTDEKVQEWQRNRDRLAAAKRPAMPASKPTTVCGQTTSHVQHTYMTSASELVALSNSVSLPIGGEKCKDCAILVQTLDRLRRNLQSPRLTSPKPVAEDTWAAYCRSENETTRRVVQRAKEQQPLKQQPQPDLRAASRPRDRKFTAEATDNKQVTNLAGTVPRCPDNNSALEDPQELAANTPTQASQPTSPNPAQLNLPFQSTPPRSNSDENILQSGLIHMHLRSPSPTSPPTQTTTGFRAPQNSGSLSPKEQSERRAARGRAPPPMSEEERERVWLEHKQADRDREVEELWRNGGRGDW
ncbi:hypothetical protein T440DRAFT_469521 [Plenodomus tracheiphilus IPT5]|uniref:Xaa-Pro aminopeptidase n=1 Tax=Plenodomus tracheiphilus IPT5 TaxID=1408161 RepID=A0A6A7B347_9PLEO|nr:hypothetical protein T440DRAFT_469521 [Plenodomus tracheiphilus IPT5]